MRVGMHLVSLLCTFSSYHPYLLLQIFSSFLYFFIFFFWVSNQRHANIIVFTIPAEMLWAVVSTASPWIPVRRKILMRMLGHDFKRLASLEKRERSVDRSRSSKRDIAGAGVARLLAARAPLELSSKIAFCDEPRNQMCSCVNGTNVSLHCSM